MKTMNNHIHLTETNEDFNNNPIRQAKNKINAVFQYLSNGLSYQEIMSINPQWSEDELNDILWYFVQRGIRYFPSLS